MKVGIMSMQRVKNYGSFLQSFGLKQTIESLGHTVVFIDYKQEAPVVPYKEENKGYKLVRSAYHAIRKNVFKVKDMYYLYDDQYLPMLGVNKERQYNTKVDVLVIGSDEVFNCLQPETNVGFSRELFGKNNNAHRVISYAASFGYTTFEGLQQYKIDNEVGELLNKFSNISVRDQNSYDIVNKLTKIEPNINVDPVIISNFDKYIPQQNKYKDYILVYSYQDRINNENEIKAIKEFAARENKKLISVGRHQEWTDIKLEADPFELLSFVKSADYIITDTFHGTIFSIKYNRPFVTIIRDSNKQKLGDLLNRFHLSNREVRDMNNLRNIILSPINFEMVNEKIAAETQKSIEYLSKNIK